jgi:lauroyl/myristoyl acyltransferase
MRFRCIGSLLAAPQITQMSQAMRGGPTPIVLFEQKPAKAAKVFVSFVNVC